MTEAVAVTRHKNEPRLRRRAGQHQGGPGVLDGIAPLRPEPGMQSPMPCLGVSAVLRFLRS